MYKEDIIIEEWRPVVGYDNRYEVSDMGNIKSLDITILCKNGRSRAVKGRNRKLVLNKKRGYYYVMLKGVGKLVNKSVHRMVAESFLGHVSGGMSKGVVDHIDSDRLNNKLSNLQILSQRSNSSKTKRGKSIYTGVCWHKNQCKWMAYIQIEGKNNHLGYFNKETDARDAYINRLNSIS